MTVPLAAPLAHRRDDPAVAVAHLAGQRLAVHVDNLLHGLHCPPNLIALPRRDGAVVGAISHRGNVIPVTDLRRWLPWPDAETPPSRLLVVCNGTSQAALLVHGIDGVSRTRRIVRLHQKDNEHDVFHTVAHLPPVTKDEAEPVVPLLDVAALLSLTATWTDTHATDASPGSPLSGVRGKSATTALSPATPLDAGRQSMALIRVGTLHLGLPVANLVMIERFPALTSMMVNSPILGIARLRGRPVPVFRSSAMTGVPDDDVPAWLAVLRHDDHWVGLPVTALDRMHTIDLQHLRPAAEAGYPEDTSLLGMIAVPGYGTVLVPDVGKLVSHFPLGRPDEPATGLATTAGMQRQPQLEAYVVLESGRTWALPLRLMDSVMPLPDHLEWLPAGEALAPKRSTPALLPVARLRHRSDTVLVWDARPLTEAPAGTPPPDKLVLLRSGTRTIGLLVNALRQILPRHRGELFSLRRSGGEAVDFLTVRQGREHKSFQIVNPTRLCVAG